MILFLSYKNEMLKLEVPLFLKCSQLYRNTHEQMHTQVFSAPLDDKENLIYFKESFLNLDYLMESDADRTAMFSKKGLR